MTLMSRASLLLAPLLLLLQSATALPVQVERQNSSFWAGHLMRQVSLNGETRNEGVFRLSAVDAAKFERIFRHFGREPSNPHPEFRSLFTCSLCQSAAGFVKTLFHWTSNKNFIVKGCIWFCKTWSIEKPDVCDSIVPLFSDMIIQVGKNLTLDSDQICGTLFGEKCGKSAEVMWKLNIPSLPPKPVVQPLKPPPSSSPRKRILHISDTHIDFDYVPGANADCDRPLCCRRIDGLAATKEAGAGFWGDDRKCDTPPWTFKNLLATLKEQEKTEGRFDYIYWTGDIPPHDIWNQSKSDQLESIKRVAELIDEAFPHTPIFPSLGNHESSPVNSYPPRNFDGKHSMAWLYEPLAANWQKWLPRNRNSSQTILRGAFYSVLVEPGFRIISLNMNYCNNHNFWLLLNLTDPLGQLEWLVDELFKAESAGEKVHILGHIPPGITDCLKSWSWNYYNIVNRFESTISGQFFGHTHYDEIELFYDQPELKRPTSVAYIAPSVTTFANLNPGYRVYEVDGNRLNSTRYVLDSFTFILNITKANLTPRKPPVWQKEYSAREAYNMTSLFPSDWHTFAHRLAVDERLFQTYIDFFYKSYANHEKDDREDILCRFVSGRSDDPQLCKEILNEFKEAEKRRKKGLKSGGGGGGSGSRMRGKPVGKVVDLC